MLSYGLFFLASALTWPMVMHPTEVIVGGGELGGWFWRQWWHYSEVKALEQEDFGLWGTIESLLVLDVFRKQVISSTYFF